ncbi:hypothetical protein ACFL3Z_02935, partial [Gemmatimonadota bacterium]
GIPALTVSFPLVEVGLITLLGLAVVNVVNFMDGIDTMVGLQALVVGGFALVKLDPQMGSWWVALGMSGSVAGFLLLNFPPAKVFLGDTGSITIGIVAFYLALEMAASGTAPLIVGLLPLAPLGIEEFRSLPVRFRRGLAWGEPHRLHLYQMLVDAGHGHLAVSSGYAILAMAAALPGLLLSSSGTGGIRPWLLVGGTAVGIFALLAGTERLLLGGKERGPQGQPDESP